MAGGLISLGADLLAMTGPVAAQIDRIIKGASPADIPVERPTRRLPDRLTCAPHRAAGTSRDRFGSRRHQTVRQSPGHRPPHNRPNCVYNPPRDCQAFLSSADGIGSAPSRELPNVNAL